MTRKIFFSNIAVSIIVIIASLLLLSGILYDDFFESRKSDLKSKAQFLASAVEEIGTDALSDISFGEKTRATYISPEGDVVFDSAYPVEELDNHSQREEIREALENKEGESSRFSSTLSEKTYNYALLLDNGFVLRLSATHDSVFALLSGSIPLIAAVILISLLISAFLAYIFSRKIVKPINLIDLDTPEKIEIYDELSPLVSKLTQQKREIDKRLNQLKRKSEELKSITENMAEGLLVINKKTELITYSKSIVKILGKIPANSKESVFSLNRNEGFIKAVENALAGNHSEEVIHIASRAYQIIATPVREGNVIDGAVIIILDTTEKEKGERLRREFSANVSHELKTPLTSISGFAEIIKNGIVSSPEDVSRFAGNIYDESQRLIALVGDIINLSHLDEKAPYERTSVPLRPIVSSVIRTLAPIAQKCSVELSEDCDDACVAGDPKLLEEMLFNLADNAIKYNKTGGKVEIILRKLGDGVSLCVRDNGIGISSEDKERVFERFYRVDKSHSKEIGGTGLGLSIVKHGAAYHNAELTLESELGQGTSVTLLFPAAQSL